MRLPVSYFLAIFLTALVSCKAPKEEPPIPAAKMEAVMLDIHLAETYSQGLGDTTGNKFDKNYDSLAVFYSSIFRHHQLSFEEFNEALNWYRKHPQQIEALYAHVIDKLNTLKAQEGIRDIDDAGIPATVPQAKDSSTKDLAPDKASLSPNQPVDTTASPALKLQPRTKEEP